MSSPHNVYLRRNENILDKLYRKHQLSHPTILNNYLKAHQSPIKKLDFVL